MGRWTRGEAAIEKMIRDGHLDQVSGASADGQSWLSESARAVGSASMLLDSDARMAYLAAYEAARFALTSVFIQQGLRPTSAGGHACLAHAAQAQFGDGFAGFDALRRRRNEIEYPGRPSEVSISRGEASSALDEARTIIDHAQQLIGQVGFF
ncbi:Uncharacterised protein (plasmid) [Tsukamurella tyrosinosolvens]|uniref:HEPN domain-containing protein n=1 Tax=Tsukamurella tyrosinosolvens TaxID=57704 RepID=A0A1H4UX49_TSUTY|nr:hypothetical protein [Tsukamurella tyrosinosolvens]KXO98399.1 hypothetical protein AXK58_25335 [Tsukamurella tyrosinosolvens]SEC72811.1 hypothetical protein SAMN04489793_3055 [Tsukamurella tyrosinosolvens]VEH90851.1 Uncharacterised protein [Tsukamurella tyrosinosolvens]